MISKLKLFLLLFAFPLLLIAQKKTCNSPEEESLEDVGAITKCSLNKDSSKGQFKVEVSMQTRYLKKRKKTNSMLLKANVKSFSNKISSEEMKKSLKFVEVEQVPGFGKCKGFKNGERLKCFNTQMMKHVEKYFNYPDEAVMKKIQGEVWVRFMIDTNGNVSNIKAIVTKKNQNILRDEALRVVSHLPNLMPATKNKKNVSVKYGFPINFVLKKK